MTTGSEQREKGLGETPGAEGIDFEDLVRPVEVVVGDAGRIAVDTGVVDQRVQPTGIGLDPVPGGIDARLVCDVELDRSDRLGLGDLAGIA